MSSRDSIAVAAAAAMIALGAGFLGCGARTQRTAPPPKQTRATYALPAGVERSAPKPARTASHARNGVIAYGWPDPEADLAYISFVPPEGGQLPAWAERMDGMEGLTPAFSPDGRSLAYAFGSGLRITRLGGGRARTLTRPTHNASDSDPTWSPHGSRLAFWRYGDTDEIYVVGSDGSHLRRLTSGETPTWSSQGLIAFVREGDIYVIDPSGGQVRQLTSGPTDDEQPAWSRDGKAIAFYRKRHLFLVRRDGGSPRQITSGRGEDSSPAFSPDGRQIVFVHVTHGRDRLTTIPVRGGTPRTLAIAEGAAGSLDWQPLR